MIKNPIGAEVRAAREKIAAECDYDLHKICEYGREVMKKWQGKIVTPEEWFRERARRTPPTKG